MSAHVLFPALDPEFPATLSERIITGLLRHQLGYEGVVFSDALEMKAISERYGIEESAEFCVRAGVDVLLYCDGFSKPVRCFDFLCQRAEADSTLRAQIEYSYARIQKLKAIYLRKFTGVDVRDLKRRLREYEHQRIVDEINTTATADSGGSRR